MSWWLRYWSKVFGVYVPRALILEVEQSHEEGLCQRTNNEPHYRIPFTSIIGVLRKTS